MNRPMIKFIADFGPILIFFTIYLGNNNNLRLAIPPFIIANGQPLKFSGINALGLRRRKFTSAQRTNIKKAYKIIYNSTCNISQAIDKIKNELKAKNEISIILKLYIVLIHNTI